MQLARASGILLHPTSLPNGVLDEEAYRFVDWLAAAGQTWWQVLPLGPPDDTGSPYASPSAFAASPALLADPKAPVSSEELEDFVARHPFWSGEWAAYAGAPPDALSKVGQRWGNPLHDWPTHRATGFRWWIERLRRTFELVDVTRL